MLGEDDYDNAPSAGYSAARTTSTGYGSAASRGTVDDIDAAIKNYANKQSPQQQQQRPPQQRTSRSRSSSPPRRADGAFKADGMPNKRTNAPIGAPASAAAAAPAAAPSSNTPTRVFFHVSMPMTYAELAANPAAAKQVFDLTANNPELKGRTVIVQSGEATVLSQSHASVLVKIGDLPTSRTVALPNGKIGASYHLHAPSVYHNTKPKPEMFYDSNSATQTLTAEQIKRYKEGEGWSAEKMLEEVQHMPDGVKTIVPLNSLIGRALQVQELEYGLKRQVATGGRFAEQEFYLAPTATVQHKAKTIASKVTLNPELSKVQTNLSRVSFELLNPAANGKWAVSEAVEPHVRDATAKADMGIEVKGHFDVVPL